MARRIGSLLRVRSSVPLARGSDAVPTRAHILRPRALLGVAWGVMLACASMSGSAIADPSLYWSYPSVIDAHVVDQLACPTTSLCVGVDAYGDVVTSTNPTGGASAWTVTNIDNSAPETPFSLPNALNAVSCPSPAGSLCVAVGEGGIYASSKPAGGAGAWLAAGGVGAHGHAVSCPSASFCVASFGYYGEVLTSNDPTGGAVAWKAAQVDGSHQVIGLSCPSESLCVGVDEAGNVITSTHPSAGEGAWTVAHVGELASVSCPSTSFCAAVGPAGLMTSTDPTGGAGAWALQVPETSETSQFHQIACASSSLCVASQLNGRVEESVDPSSGARAWGGQEGLDGTNGLSAVACPSESLCFVTDEALVIGVPAHSLSVSITGMGDVSSTPIACEYGCTYSGPVCPRNCGGRFANAYIPQRLREITCDESALFGAGSWGTCSLSFPAQNTVILTATPESGWTFAGWSGACSGTGGCQTPMSVDQAVVAHFTATVDIGTAPERPSISQLAQSAPLWRRGSRRSRITGRKRPPIGTVFSFDLNEAANVEFSFARSVGGREVKGNCVAQTEKDTHGRHCTRRSIAGTLTFAAHSGTTRMRFEGLVSRHKQLRPGNYTLLVKATASGQVSATTALSFTIASD